MARKIKTLQERICKVVHEDTSLDYYDAARLAKKIMRLISDDNKRVIKTLRKGIVKATKAKAKTFPVPTKHECSDCATRVDVTHGACPYNLDINGDDKPVWLCGNCRYQRAMDI